MLCTGLPTHIPNENRNVNFPTLLHPNKDKAKHLRISGAILFQQIAKPDKIQVEPPPYPSANMRLVMTLAHHHSMGAHPKENSNPRTKLTLTANNS